jgi:hypothetical protein
MGLNILYIFVAVIVVSGCLAIQKRQGRSISKGGQQKNFPGPYLLPYIGRVHDLPINYVWIKFKEWADLYGPIYRTKMLGAKFIIISDEKIAEDLLVKRAKIYSDRPVVRSLFDSKSAHGSMEYLPLMGKNSKRKLLNEQDYRSNDG